jgi:hypothetical protein
MKVYVFESGKWDASARNGFSQTDAATVLETAARKAMEQLPQVAGDINIAIRPHFLGIIPEYGVGGYTHDSTFVEIKFDEKIPYGVEKLKEYLLQTVFHELNHAARYATTEYDSSFMNYVITEGLATVFERDYAESDALYAQYEDDETMQLWLAEIKNGDWDKKDELFFDNPDGRKWIGYKVGTWLIDKAVKNSGKTVVDLTSLPCGDIVKFAGIEAQNPPETPKRP